MVTTVDSLSWYWMAVGAIAPAAGAWLIALPFWRKGQTIFGNVAGTGVIFATAVALILREYADLDRMTKACLDAGTVCFLEPSAFTRFAIYAFIGLIQIFVLFSVSLKVEERARRRNYSREWQ